MHRNSLSCLWLLGLVLLAPGPAAWAQYEFDPLAADEQVPGIRYFGTVKDENGILIKDATISIDSDLHNMMFLTDEQGRFHASLPLESVPEKVTVGCWKAGYSLVRVSKRPGPAGVKPAVQIACILRAVARK